MEPATILLAALAGTIVMTAFSFAVSAAYRKLFKEPVLINYMLSLLGVEISNRNSAIGYVLHYIFGVIFVLAYELVWENTSWRPTWDFAVVFGMLSGVVGIIGWMIIFSLPSKNPRVHFKEYYIQLFVAHIIFALGVVAVYKVMV